MIDTKVDLRTLIGKTLRRGDVILKVGAISVRGQIYVHPEGLESFGWTLFTSDGALCGEWEEVVD